MTYINAPLTHSEDIKDIAAALAKAQGAMKPAIFNKVNPHFKNKYADFSSCMEACRAPLSENGIAVMQYPISQEGKIVLVTMLAHQSGQWIKSEFPLNSEKLSIQGIGSAMTYAKRYTLCGIVGIVSDEEAENDDDGEAAVGRAFTETSRKSPYKPKYEASIKATEEKVETITPAQAEELKLLKSTATQEMCIKVDNILAQKQLKSFKDLPESGFDFIKGLLIKNQKPDFILGDDNE